jgi:hypothetical protein
MASAEVFNFTNKSSFNDDPNFDIESSADSALSTTSSSASPSSTSSSGASSTSGGSIGGNINQQQSVAEIMFDDNDENDEKLDGSLENESLSDAPDQDCNICQ